MVAEQAEVLGGMAAALEAMPEAKEPVYVCAVCQDSQDGFYFVVDGQGNRFARRCPCRVPSTAARMTRIGVPARNAECTMDSLAVLGRDRSVALAALAARSFCREFPVGTAGKGLLLVGPCGTGKTHLATGMLRELVCGRGASGRFCDFRELFARLRRTYSKDAQEDERAVLAELFAADVVVIDDLGAGRVTDWSYDVAQSVINELYGRRGAVVLTTNLPNLPQGERLPGGAETLGDRIGQRSWSRLQEICRVMPMDGADFRVGHGR